VVLNRGQVQRGYPEVVASVQVHALAYEVLKAQTREQGVPVLEYGRVRKLPSRALRRPTRPPTHLHHLELPVLRRNMNGHHAQHVLPRLQRDTCASMEVMTVMRVRPAHQARPGRQQNEGLAAVTPADMPWRHPRRKAPGRPPRRPPRPWNAVRL
jgi:hypothetical protein